MHTNLVVLFSISLRSEIGNRPNTVSESTVSNIELSELFGPHRVPGRELSDFLSAYYLCVKANSPSFSQNSPSLPQNSVSSLSRNSTLETVFRPFPTKHLSRTGPCSVTVDFGCEAPKFCFGFCKRVFINSSRIAGNSMTNIEGPSPEPLLKKEARLA